MDNIEIEASQYLVDLLGKIAGYELSDEERRAAFKLVCTLPDRATIKDFMAACEESDAARVGLPAEVARTLQPLSSALERNVSYAGKYASLFEQRT
ncbi:hypothetical protein [Paraburkholderia graminis]|uniref:Uncharacterized protein n=1 Tax=Paraburkholderia graminis TaxID=60548 RepID=A0ABD5CSQ6_9BURK|nr:hypothetical protein [Paraburkholderia graminis]MDR6208179.1 hypothetical protein [Paraburkholderia graminis]